MARTIDDYKKIIQNTYLDHFNMEFDEHLAYSPFNFTPVSDIGKEHREDALGNLISDAYIYAVKEAEGPDYEPIAMTVAPSGMIRSSFVVGNISVSDAFDISHLGSDLIRLPAIL